MSQPITKIYPFITTSHPAGPGSSSFAQVKEWIEDPINFWEKCFKQYGENFTVELGSLGTIVLFSNPSAIKEIFALSHNSFECHQYNDHYKYVMGNQSLLVQDGLRHKRQRRLLLPPMHYECLSAYSKAISNIAQELTEKWPVDEALGIRPLMHDISLQIVLTLVFGSLKNELSKQLREIYKLYVIKEIGSWSPWARFGRIQPKIRQLISAEIKRRQEQSVAQSSDIFSLLLLAKDEDGEPLSEAEIQDHIFTFLIAGVDPTALALTWAFYWIHELPSVLLKLLEEIDTLRQEQDIIKFLKLPYLNAVYQEVLRMYPVVTTPSGRKLTEPVKIAGNVFEAGIILLPCTYLVHRREDLYPDPYSFKPERFLNRQFAPYEYFPFGGGNRFCIGAALGQMQLKLVIASLLLRWDFESANEGAVKPVRHGTLLAPSDEMKIVVKGLRN